MKNTNKMARVLQAWRPTICIVRQKQFNDHSKGLIMLVRFELLDNGTIFFEYNCNEPKLGFNTLDVQAFCEYWEIDIRELLNQVS